MFHRFITCVHSSGRCRPRGIFQDFDEIVRGFKERRRLEEARRLRSQVGHRLKVPPRRVFHSGRALCWLRTEAVELRDGMRAWLVLLQLEGIRVREVSSMDPGLITYRDEHQVVALPYEHAWWRR